MVLKSYVLFSPNRFYEAIEWRDLEIIKNQISGSSAKSVKNLEETRQLFHGKPFEIVKGAKKELFMILPHFNLFVNRLSNKNLIFLRQKQMKIVEVTDLDSDVYTILDDDNFTCMLQKIELTPHCEVDRFIAKIVHSNIKAEHSKFKIQSEFWFVEYQPYVGYLQVVENYLRFLKTVAKPVSMVVTNISEIFSDAKPNQRIFFTDGGGTSSYGGHGGFGAVEVDRSMNILRSFSHGYAKTTNNMMELSALLAIILNTKEDDEIAILADSQYTIDVFTKWIGSWLQNPQRFIPSYVNKGGKEEPSRVKNADLILLIVLKWGRRKISFCHVKGHSGQLGNELADQLTWIFRDTYKTVFM